MPLTELPGITEPRDVHLLRLEHLERGSVEDGERCLREMRGVELANRLVESPLA